MTFLNPGLWLALLLTHAVLFGVGYYRGDKSADAAHAVAQAKADSDAQEKYNVVSQELEDAKASQKTITRTVTKWRDKVITRDVYRNACLDDDGMRLFNEAIRAKNPGELDAAMSGSPAAK